MGKFILGILAIILLQVIFFGYTSRYWSIPSEPRLVKSRPAAPDMRRPNDIARVETPTAPVSEPPSSAPQTQKRSGAPATATAAAATSRYKSFSAQPIRKRAVTDRAPSNTYTARTETRFSSVIPKGHTMVLVDNLAPSPRAGTVATVDVDKPRKRSLLAKSFSVVVKKPWGWMKSLASKLD